jgi:hypothetical protein
MRLQSAAELFREGQAIARARVDRVERRTPDDAIVEVCEVGCVQGCSGSWLNSAAGCSAEWPPRGRS